MGSAGKGITFLQNERILNLCLRLHILRSYCIVGEVTFKQHFFCTFSGIYPINFIVHYMAQKTQFSFESQFHRYIFLLVFVFATKLLEFSVTFLAIKIVEVPISYI